MGDDPPASRDLSVEVNDGYRSGPPASAPESPPTVPPALESLVTGATWVQVWVKEGSEVWRLRSGGEGSLAGSAGAGGAGERYLKMTAAAGHDGTAAEAERLRWLHGRAPVAVPEVLAHVVDGETGWLLTAAVSGTPAHEPTLRMTSVGPLVEALGVGLRAFHEALQPDDCPFARSVDDLLASAERRVAAGDVDPARMGPTYRRHTAEQLLDRLVTSRPDEPMADRVVAHGDPCQPNLLVGAVGLGTIELAGVVDVVRLGVSDRYRDLAILARSLTQNLGPEVVYRFFDAYGLPHPDPLRLEWWVLVDDMW